MNGRPFNGWQREASPTHNTTVPVVNVPPVNRVSNMSTTECQPWAQTRLLVGYFTLEAVGSQVRWETS